LGTSVRKKVTLMVKETFDSKREKSHVAIMDRELLNEAVSDRENVHNIKR
jgi:hypothetical protein